MKNLLGHARVFCSCNLSLCVFVYNSLGLLCLFKKKIPIQIILVGNLPSRCHISPNSYIWSLDGVIPPTRWEGLACEWPPLGPPGRRSHWTVWRVSDTDPRVSTVCSPSQPIIASNSKDHQANYSFHFQGKLLAALRLWVLFIWLRA